MGCVGSKELDTDGQGTGGNANGTRSAGVPAKPAQSGAAAATKAKSAKTVLNNPTEDVTAHYNLARVLGRGQFGVTRLAEDKNTGDKYACKTISKRKLTSKEDIEDVRREIQIMHHLAGDPNVVRLKGSYEDKNAVHLVMELCGGGELFDRIVAKGHYTEKDAAAAVRTIVRVVAHCHKMGVIHRDLKPENFLLTDKTETAKLKCTDFGLSVFFQPGQQFSEIVGSAYYVAPEVLKRSYSYECDIWSCGVMLYILLSGVPPFWGETEQQIFQSILKGQLDFKSDPWPSITKEAKDCVALMLQMDPKKRANAEDILKHPWMCENGVASDKPLDNVILNRMRHFSNMNKLKREALKFIATNLGADEIAGLQAVFKSLDVDNSGTITVEEMREGLKQMGSNLNQGELDTLIEQMDVDKSGTIDYEEFVTATLNLAQLEREELLKKAFEHFDTDGSGYITPDELQNALKQMGTNPAEIRDILEQVDRDGDGRIDYDEFVDMMMAGNDQSMRQTSTARGSQNMRKRVLNARG